MRTHDQLPLGLYIAEECVLVGGVVRECGLEVGQQWRVGVEWAARSVCTGDPPDLCYDKTAKYSGVLQVAILYIYMYIGRLKDKRSSCVSASEVTRRRAVCR